MKRWKLYFKFDHLPENLQAVSKPFHDLAVAIVGRTWNGDAEAKIYGLELSVIDTDEFRCVCSLMEDVKSHAHFREPEWALRCLLRAKDCAVRAHLPDPVDDAV